MEPKLIRVSDELVINALHVAYVERRPDADATVTVHMAVVAPFGCSRSGGGYGHPVLVLTGDEAKRAWDGLTRRAE